MAQLAEETTAWYSEPVAPVTMRLDGMVALITGAWRSGLSRAPMCYGMVRAGTRQITRVALTPARNFVESTQQEVTANHEHR